MKKVAILELGTTSIKLVVAEITSNQSFVVIDRYEDRIKAALDITNFDYIKPQCIASITTVLKTYRAIIAASSVDETFAVAVSEYQNLKNEKSLFDEIYNLTNFHFKVLNSSEQAFNGTNTQMLSYSRRNIISQCNIPFGAVNLVENTEDSQFNPAETMPKMIEKFAKSIENEEWLSTVDNELQMIGTGDVFLTISKLSRKLKHYPYNKDHSYSFTIEDLDKVYDFVKSLDIDKTKKLKGISSERADVLASGLCIVKAVAEKVGIKKFLVSNTGLAEGYLLNALNANSPDKSISDVLGVSLKSIDEYYNNSNIKNTENVYEISLMLFKQLKVLHKLPRSYVKVLRVASFMHNCGKRISPVDYERNGFSVVLNSEIYGISQYEQVLASFVVACQKFEDFSMTDWVKYSSMLNETDLEGVRKLAVIVRLASLLDMFGSGKIRDISCDILGDSVIMKTIVDTPADMEIMEGLKLSNDFAKAFKKHLEIL